MIKYKENQPVTERTRVRGGDGTYFAKEIFSGEEVDKTTLFSMITLPPETSIGIHPHEQEGEAYVIVSGEAEVTEDGKTYLLHAGDAEYCTGGHTHGIANHSKENVQFLAIIMK